MFLVFHVFVTDLRFFSQSSKLTSKLKKLDRALDDYVASQFLRALVKVIGGYRDALRFKESDGEEVGIVAWLLPLKIYFVNFYFNFIQELIFSTTNFSNGPALH